MKQYKQHCEQCGQKLRGHYQFYVCGECYTKNSNEKQRQLLAKEKERK